VERSFRTLAAFSREYTERAFSDNEEAQTYWPYGFNQVSTTGPTCTTP
jgi:hypothetical protein